MNLFRGKHPTNGHGVPSQLAEGEYIIQDPSTAFESNLTLGQRLADKIARFGGSWTFICLFIGFILMWVGLNSYILINLNHNTFDPFPYVLLNLSLSMVAALQAPLILMSQNRQAERDRIAANINYETTLKIELELTRLHHKMDQLNDAVIQLQNKKS